MTKPIYRLERLIIRRSTGGQAGAAAAYRAATRRDSSRRDAQLAREMLVSLPRTPGMESVIAGLTRYRIED